ncbi:MAG TPA: hypothetical protein VFI81_07255, partial [Rhodanobacteraceae bacterium]|nr:hypothetical protein [Rhodanobacteraceae bacterium]
MTSRRQWLVAACLLLACTCARAAVRMQAESLALTGITLADVRMDASLATDGRPRLTLDAEKVSVP